MDMMYDPLEPGQEVFLRYADDIIKFNLGEKYKWMYHDESILGISKGMFGQKVVVSNKHHILPTPFLLDGKICVAGDAFINIVVPISVHTKSTAELTVYRCMLDTRANERNRRVSDVGKIDIF